MKLTKGWMAGIAAGLLGLSLLVAAPGAGAQGLMRWSLLAGVLVGGALWVGRARGRSTQGGASEPLKLLGRLGLSQSVSLSLVEVEGKAFLVAHGNGFAQLRELSGKEVVS